MAVEFSSAWLLVAVLLALMVQQNQDVDLARFACTSERLRQLYDVLGFLAGFVPSGADAVAACSGECTQRIVRDCGGVGIVSEVLELGFGTGHLAKEVLEHGRVRYYDGVELSEGMLNLTARRLKWHAEPDGGLYHSHQPLELLLASERLRTYSHAFAIFVLDVLASSDIRLALEGIHRRLKPGGRACIAVMADLYDEIPVALYKTAWRIAPTMFGGRRPVSLPEFISDIETWLPVANWTDRSGWLPVQVYVLEKLQSEAVLAEEAESLQLRRLAAMRRWARYLHGQAGGSGRSWGELISASVHTLPAGTARDVVSSWLPELSDATITLLVKKHIATLSKKDFLELHQEGTSAMPTAQMLEMLRASMRDWDTHVLEDYVQYPVDDLDAAELREYIKRNLDDVMAAGSSEPELVAELVQYQQDLESAKSQGELRKLNRRIEDALYLRPADMSREELEEAVYDQLAHLPRAELEEVVFDIIDSMSTKELREWDEDDVDRMEREELMQRAVEAVGMGGGDVLLPALQEIVRTHLSREDLGALAELAAGVDETGD